MRIACVHLPCFPLQSHVRAAPHLAGQAFAVAGAGTHPTVLVCSRAASDAGVRPGMTPTQARALRPELAVLPADPPAYRRALEALGEALLGCSMTVDLGDPANLDDGAPHRSIYVLVPPRARGATFGAELAAAVAKQGLRARIGIADDRFTAWVAAGARGEGNVFTVPRGGAAAFLAPQPLALLPMDDDVRQMLHTLGIRTLGQFAALPPPSVGQRWGGGGVDVQALARGDGATVLHGFAPREAVEERIDLDHEVSDLEPLAFLLRPLADRVCERLCGRGRAAARLVVRLHGRPGELTEIPITPSSPTRSGRTVLDLTRARLAEQALTHAVLALAIAVIDEADPEAVELDLFDRRDHRAGPEAVDVALARLRAAFGPDAAGAAQLVDTYRPEAAFLLTPFVPPLRAPHRTRRGKQGRRRPVRAQVLPLAANGMVGALRLIDPPAAQPDDLRTLEVAGTRAAVVASRGPTRLETEWWTDEPLARDYYEVETADGGRYWVFRRRSDGRVFLHGIFD